MDNNQRLLVAQKLVRIADMLLEGDVDVVEEEVDPRFIEKVRALKMSLPKLTQKKNRKLRQFGIGVIRPNSSVEDLVDALSRVVTQ